jgi:hypothetical protein
VSERTDEVDGSRLRGWLVPGALLLVAAVALLVTIAPHSGPSPSPRPSSSTSPAQSPDAHLVVTDEGVVSFQFEVGAIVVRLTKAGVTTELGRAALQTEAPSPGASAAPVGTELFAMVCGPADSAESRRYVFGHTDSGSGVQYSGPQAVGQGASDGLFLFALLPGPMEGQPAIQVRAGKTGPRGGFPVSVSPVRSATASSSPRAVT